MFIEKYISTYMYMKRKKLMNSSHELKDSLKLSRKKIFNRINFINFFLKKKQSFFQDLFNDFCLSFKKKFESYFSSYISIKLLQVCVDYYYKNNCCERLQYRGKRFFFNDDITPGLLLIKNDFFFMFVQRLFGNHADNLYNRDSSKHLTLNEMNILELLFENIFFILNKTTKNVFGIFQFNREKCIELNYLVCQQFFHFSYACFIFQIHSQNKEHFLKIYIPYKRVMDCYKNFSE
ncbi:hypothetical protein [Buchnera aphidicola]|uniref:hypothetical protein n=1 Tax=Buchnera aphidicola TaxID=9 RepID=UPI0012ACE624|nr:hypothetical protein [Buchnera aphidicola]